MSATPFWDPRSEDDHFAMADLLAPLIVASKDRNFIGKEAAKAQTYAWRLSLADVPRRIFEEAITNLILAGIDWMPRPGEVKKECAKVMAAKRKAAARLHLADCDHSSHFIEEPDRFGVLWATRCPCWQRAQVAMDLIGQAIALPDGREEREALL